MSSFQSRTKRTFDLLCSSIGLLIILLPSMAIAVLVKLSSRGPVFYLQQRVGQRGNLFTVIKFRTMHIGSEYTGTITSAHDERITPIGHFLREYKLDEIPQLWNVFIGKMSFVGPRPDVAGYADRLTGENRKILELRPGITGPASLFFRNEEELLSKTKNPKIFNDATLWPKKVELNLEYYYHWSFWKDIGYIVVTVFPVFNRIFKLVSEQTFEYFSHN
jgi:lipopolysaccharide/colanic/teichoic acid biosynthesis glycosyltransferase